MACSPFQISQNPTITALTFSSRWVATSRLHPARIRQLGSNAQPQTNWEVYMNFFEAFTNLKKSTEAELSQRFMSLLIATVVAQEL